MELLNIVFHNIDLDLWTPQKLMSTVVKRYNCIIFILDLGEEKQPEIQRNKMDKIQEDI